MISIGNDIVSLKSPRSSRFAQKEYYSKIFSIDEELLYDGKISLWLTFKDFVWLLWTVKEAAYKFFKRSNSRLLFNPTKIFVKTIEKDKDQFENILFEKIQPKEKCFVTGSVYVENEQAFFKSIITGDFIFTVTNANNEFGKVFSGIKQVNGDDYKTQSQEVRNFFMKNIRQNFPHSFLSIEKSMTGYPVLIKDDIKSDICISFSHHGSWVAYTLIAE